jgi:hypothetical protein
MQEQQRCRGREPTVNEKQVKKQWEEQSRAVVAKSFAPGGKLEHFDKQPVAAQVIGIAALLESAIAERDWLTVVVAQQALQKTIAVAKGQLAQSGPPQIETPN